MSLDQTTHSWVASQKGLLVLGILHPINDLKDLSSAVKPDSVVLITLLSAFLSV